VKIQLAKKAGFCYGVRRAVDMVYEQAEQSKQPVYTFGPITHNDIVVEDLKNKGVRVLDSIEEAEQLSEGTVIIRAHGVPKELNDRLCRKDERGTDILNVMDATCPFVKKIHEIVKKQGVEGRVTVIFGDSNHPEVQGIIGWCTGEYYVLKEEEEVLHFAPVSGTKLAVVAQTTYNYKKFQQFVEIILKKGYDSIVYDTICNATEVRQSEAYEMAGNNEAMIVIGGKHSSNTRKLFEICKTECANTYFIEQPDDLDLELLRSFHSVGITAGASTPNNIIKEVFSKMSETSFEQLLAEEQLVSIHNGQVIEGTVIRVKEDEIALNIGYKADGIVTRSEYTNTPGVDLRTLVKEGDTMQVKVLKVNDGDGQVALTYKRLAAERGSKRLEEAFNNKEVLTATVTDVLKGGLSLVVDETRVFIPASLVSDTFEQNLEKYKDHEIQFVITEFNPKRRRIIGDRKQLLVAKKKELQAELFSKIAVGDIISGVIKNVTDFGVFIDLGGADGLLHISEMSWGRIENPKKVFKVGDEVRAFIKDISGEKIALSMKFPDENPWADAEEKFAKGNVVTGKVARMTDFGAFIEIEPGVDALLHVSQISREHIEKPASVLKVGQEIEAMIVDFNYEDKKISLSMKALLPQEAAEEAVEEAVEVAEENAENSEAE